MMSLFLWTGQQLAWALFISIVVALPTKIIAASAQDEKSCESSLGAKKDSVTSSSAVESHRLNAEGLRLMEGGQIRRAAEAFRRAVKADPGNTEALNNLGIAVEKGGDIQEAVSIFHRALRLAPQNAQIHSNLALALRRSGHSHEAVLELTQ